MKNWVNRCIYSILLILIAQHVQANNKDGEIILAQVNQAQVAKHAVTLKKEMDLHRKCRIGLQTAGASLMMYQLYVMAKAFGFVGKKKDNELNGVAGQQVAAAQDKKGWGAAIKDFFTSRDTYYTLASSGLELGSMVVFQKALEELQRRVFESDSIAWLTTLRAPIRVTFAELQQWTSLIIMMHDDNSPRAAYMRTSFVHAIKKLVGQIEMIVGYMHYKICRLDTRTMQEGKQIPQELMMMVDGRLLAIQKHINTEDVSEQKIIEELLELQRIVELECMHFARVEGTVWHDAALA